ncbi:MAG: hypothetical protein ACXAC7_21740 [Candidatus Hodarchaeales archaeon]|jgi:hypothetical protein
MMITRIDLAKMQPKIKQDLNKYQEIFSQRIERFFDEDEILEDDS